MHLGRWNDNGCREKKKLGIVINWRAKTFQNETPKDCHTLFCKSHKNTKCIRNNLNVEFFLLIACFLDYIRWRNGEVDTLRDGFEFVLFFDSSVKLIFYAFCSTISNLHVLLAANANFGVWVLTAGCEPVNIRNFNIPPGIW